MRTSLYAISILSALTAFPANSQDVTSGNRLAEGCISALDKEKRTEYKDYLLTGFCQGIAVGVFDSRKTLSFCPPSKIQLGQLIKVVSKYLDNNPDKLHLQASVLAELSFIEAWPC